MMRWFSFLLLVLAFASGAFAAGLVVPQDGIALGEVQPGEAIEKAVVTAEVKMMAGGTVAEFHPSRFI